MNNWWLVVIALAASVFIAVLGYGMSEEQRRADELRAHMEKRNDREDSA